MQTAPDPDWPAICRRAAQACAGVMASRPTIADRSLYVGLGEGGDNALEIDRLCEDAVFEELEALAATGVALTVISEERGEVLFGSGEARTWVVVDPIDGSLNARRTIPSCALSIAVASGPSMADVEFAFVHDFGASEEFLATRGGGAWLNGIRIDADAGRAGLEVIGLESTDPDRVAAACVSLSGHAYRLRAVGAIALSLSYVAAGRFDGFASLHPCRSVDAAAAQLIAREAGAQVRFGGVALEEAELSLSARYPVAGARSSADLPVLEALLK